MRAIATATDWAWHADVALGNLRPVAHRRWANAAGAGWRQMRYPGEPSPLPRFDQAAAV